MTTRKGFIAIALVLGVALGSLGCPEKKGPMEKAGEKVDEAVDEVMNPGEGPLEEAGRKIDEAVDDARD